jgi:WD40 repeat protein
VQATLLAAGCFDGTVIVWGQGSAVHDLARVKLFEMRKHTDWVRCIQWNKFNGHLFVTGSNDNVIKANLF